MVTSENGRVRNVCNDHEDLVDQLRILVGDLKWVIRIGKWVGGACGMITLAMVPFVIAFFVHQSTINSRMTSLETRISEMSRIQAETNHSLVKHAEQPAHMGSGQSLAAFSAKLDSLCSQVYDLKARIDQHVEKTRTQ